MLRNKRAQSTLEYIIVLTAIVGAILYGAQLVGGRTDSEGVKKLMKKSAEVIQNSANKLSAIVPSTAGK